MKYSMLLQKNNVTKKSEFIFISKKPNIWLILNNITNRSSELCRNKIYLLYCRNKSSLKTSLG